MSPDSNNYFVIIIRSFSANHASFQKIQIFSPSFFAFFSVFHQFMILQTVYIYVCTCARSARAPSLEAIYSNIVINGPAFLFIYAICNHFGNFYFLHGIGIGVFPSFSIQ